MKERQKTNRFLVFCAKVFSVLFLLGSIFGLFYMRGTYENKHVQYDTLMFRSLANNSSYSADSVLKEVATKDQETRQLLGYLLGDSLLSSDKELAFLYSRYSGTLSKDSFMDSIVGRGETIEQFFDSSPLTLQVGKRDRFLALYKDIGMPRLRFDPGRSARIIYSFGAGGGYNPFSRTIFLEDIFYETSWQTYYPDPDQYVEEFGHGYQFRDKPSYVWTRAIIANVRAVGLQVCHFFHFSIRSPYFFSPELTRAGDWYSDEYADTCSFEYDAHTKIYPLLRSFVDGQVSSEDDSLSTAELSLY